MKRWRPPRPPVLVTYGASRRRTTTEHRLALSLARLRCAERDRTVFFSPTSAHSSRFGLVTDSEKVRVGRRGWWRGRCDRTPPRRLLTARCTKYPANSHDLYPRCCLRSPTPEQRRRRPLVGRMSQLPAAYRPQPHSSTACARALAGRPTCTRFSLRGTDGQIRAAQQACWRLASL